MMTNQFPWPMDRAIDSFDIVSYYKDNPGSEYKSPAEIVYKVFLKEFPKPNN